MAATPTSRSLELLRRRGYTVAKVEHWNNFARRRQDLFGWADILAIRADRPGVLGVQTTSADNMAARLRKIASEPSARVWLLAGNRIVVHGWAKRHGNWILRRKDVALEDMQAKEDSPEEHADEAP